MESSLGAQIDICRLRQRLSYDSLSGRFTWLDGRYRGNIAGYVTKRGYVRINIDRHTIEAHRVAWAVVHGYWPETIDHADGCKSNNALANLREATRSENSANSGVRKNNKSGLKGVSWDHDHGEWRSVIYKDKKRYHLGYFANATDAHKAYVRAAKEMFGHFARVS